MNDQLGLFTFPLVYDDEEYVKKEHAMKLLEKRNQRIAELEHDIETKKVIILMCEKEAQQHIEKIAEFESTLDAIIVEQDKALSTMRSCADELEALRHGDLQAALPVVVQNEIEEIEKRLRG